MTNNYHLWKAHPHHWSYYNTVLKYCIEYYSIDLMLLILDELNPNMCDAKDLVDIIRVAVGNYLPSSVVKKLYQLISPNYLAENSNDIKLMLSNGYCHLVGTLRRDTAYLVKCIERNFYEEIDYLLPQFSAKTRNSLLDILRCQIDERMLDILLNHCDDNQLLYYYQIKLGRQVELPKYDEMELYLWLVSPQDCEVICSSNSYNLTISILTELDNVPPCLVNFPDLIVYISVFDPKYYLKILEELDINEVHEVYVDGTLSDKLREKLNIIEIIE